MQITKVQLFVHRLEVLEILQNLFESCHLEKSGRCHQLKRITNRASEASASNLASCCQEFRDHESDGIRGEFGDLRGHPRLRSYWPSYLRMLTNRRARTRSLNLRGFCAGSCIIKFAAISYGGFDNSTNV